MHNCIHHCQNCAYPCDHPMGWRDMQHLRRLDRDWKHWQLNLGPADLDPLRCWLREQMPAGAEGFTITDLDIVTRAYSDADPTGVVRIVEVKQGGATSTTPQRHAYEALAEGRTLPQLTLYLDADIPGYLRHWPTPCPICERPRRPKVSKRIEVQRIGGRRRTVTPQRLVAILLEGWNSHGVAASG